MGSARFKWFSPTFYVKAILISLVVVQVKIKNAKQEGDRKHQERDASGLEQTRKENGSLFLVFPHLIK